MVAARRYHLDKRSATMNVKTLARIRALLAQVELIESSNLPLGQLGKMRAEAFICSIDIDIALSKLDVPVEEALVAR